MIGHKKNASTNASAYAQLKALAERQDALERKLDALVGAIETLEKRLAERGIEPDFSAQKDTMELLVEGAPEAASVKKHGVKVEVKAVIAAAAAVAGEMAKVRKVRALPAGQDPGSAWSQQGRVGVVSSHHLR